MNKTGDFGGEALPERSVESCRTENKTLVGSSEIKLSGGPDPSQVLQGLAAGDSEYGSLSFGMTDNYNASAETYNNPGTSFILLNDNIYGAFAEESPLQQAQTLIHELGHLYYNDFGPSSTAIKPDNGTVDTGYTQGQANINQHDSR